MSLSVGIITYNEEKDIKKTIDSVKDIADEVIIVDSHSTDRTVEIAEKEGAKVFVENWKGYGEQKNSVIDKCKNEWVLLIDADEIVSKELSEEIKNIITNKSSHDVYNIRFITICFGKIIKYGGWSGHYRIRLFKKNSGRFNKNLVHERFITEKEVGKINKNIYHHTYEDLDDYFVKFNRYTTEAALQYKKDGKKRGFLVFLVASYFIFIRKYILQLGFLDGYEGYLLSKLHSFYVFVKYSKLKEKNSNEKNMLF